MKNTESAEFLVALQAKDAKAAEEMVRRYEPLLRRVIRMRLTDPRLRRVFDSMDICQSIRANFFEEIGRGQLHVNTEAHLGKLLVRMAVNKLIDKIRRERPIVGNLPPEWDPAAVEPPPSEVLAQQDSVQTILNRLSEKERWLAEQRAQGRSWVEIARETGERPDTLRIMHARAIAKVRRQVRAEES